MLCSRCKKRPAVIFISKSDGTNSVNEGLCLKCAKELNIKPINDAMDKMGISEEQLDALENEMMDMMDISEMEDADGDGDMGRTAAFPFMQNIFGGMMPKKDEDEKENSDGKKAGKEKKEKNKKFKFLGTYCVNLNAKVKEGKTDRIIGRDKEIERTIQILCRRSKNNPCLIGEPGVGKTAIAEGIAARIVSGQVPVRMLDSEIYLLDLAALVAGTQFRGQFESRIKGLVEEIKQVGNVILFIDEVHNLVGAGDAEGSMNAANILKPSLSRGEIQVIGATTFEEYRKYIEKDAALERRFQPVKVEEPSVSDTIDMLIGIKDYYENFHNVRISDAIIAKIVSLSERYITDRFLPDKAIDLLDEASTCCSLRNQAAEDVAGKKRELKKIQEERSQTEHIIEEQTDMEASESQELFARAAQLKADECRVTEEIAKYSDSDLIVEVTLADAAKVIELWTGIPAAQVQEKELAKLSGIEEAVKKRLVGQDEAVDAVAAAVRRNRVRLTKTGRPASFIFVGPTGVGKTELVKVLAQTLFDTPDALIRFDMSEFMEKHAVSRLIGSPPGYVGYDEAGQLTEKIRRKPYSVVLFDEIEKAHPDVMNILLQILDDGRITDAHGRTVNFENTVIVMTSNAGSQNREGAMGFGRTAEAVSKDKAIKGLKEFLRPEFLGRVDEVVVFRSLDDEDFVAIAKIMLDDMMVEAKDKGILASYDEAAVKLIVDIACKDKSGGAREIRHTIRKQVEDKLAEVIVQNENRAFSAVITAENGKIILK